MSIGDSEQMILASNRDEFVSRPTRPSRVSTGSDYRLDPTISSNRSSHRSPIPSPESPPRYLLGPRDEHMDLKGTWFLSSSNSARSGGRRWAIVTNVRRGEASLAMFEGTFFPKAVCYFLIFVSSCMVFKSSREHYHAIQSSVDSRENIVYEYLVDTLGPSVHVPSSPLHFLAQFLSTALDVRVFPPVFLLLVLVPLLVYFYGLQGKVSRGLLVTSFVEGSDLSPLAFCRKFRSECRGLQYDGFNLICGIGNDACYLSNRPATNIGGLALDDDNGFTCYITALKPGSLYGLSNAGLDCTWHKVTKGKDAFCIAVRRGGCRGSYTSGLAPPPKLSREQVAEELLGPRTMCDEEQCRVQTTGCPYPLEKLLARVKVPLTMTDVGKKKKKDKYGTRCTIIAFLGWHVGDIGDFGDMEMYECEYGGENGETKSIRAILPEDIEDAIMGMQTENVGVDLSGLDGGGGGGGGKNDESKKDS